MVPRPKSAKKAPSKKEQEFHGFYEDLCQTVKAEEGIYSDIIRHAPDFFKLLCNLLSDDRINWHNRLLINAALAYFVVPNDVISEKKVGAIGYIDDVFICAHVLERIKKNVGTEVIVDNWEGKEDILETVDQVYKDSKKIIRKEYMEILEFAGLRKEGLTVSPRSAQQLGASNYDEVTFENKELKSMVAYLTRKVYKTNYKPWDKNLLAYIREQDYGHEINLILKSAYGLDILDHDAK